MKRLAQPTGRIERVLRSYRASACEEVEVTEHYTLRCTTPDGRVIRHDGRDLWCCDGFSWHGVAPDGWSDLAAVPEESTRYYTEERDFS